MFSFLNFLKKKPEIEDTREIAHEDIFLEVPFIEKDEAKSLGAKWNPKVKKWYIPKNHYMENFIRWIPKVSVNNEYSSYYPTVSCRTMGMQNIVLDPVIYLVKSYDNCYRCKSVTEVFCLACDSITEDGEKLNSFQTISNLTNIEDEHLESLIKKHAQKYYLDYTKQSDSTYYVNHCTCGAKLGDFYMHNEPGGSFHPDREDLASEIMLYRLPITNGVVVNASFGSTDFELIKKFAKRNSI